MGAEAEVGHAGGHEQRHAAEESALDQDHTSDARQDVAQHDLAGGESGHACGVDERLLSYGQGGGAYDTGEGCAQHQAHGQHGQVDMVAEDGEDHEEDHHAGHRHDHVGDGPQHAVDASSEEAGQDAEQHPEDEGDQDRLGGVQQRGAGAVDQSAEGVPADLVGAEPVSRARTLAGRGELAGGGRLQGKPRGQQRGEDQQDEIDQGGEGRGFVREPAQGVRQLRGAH